MPIKWTPEIDQILLLKILETSNVNADVKAISAAWPDNFEKPTPRAITERLVKIRGTAKSAGAASHFSVSGAKTTSQGGTPRKPRAQKPNGVKKNTTPKKDRGKAGAGKRKRVGRMSDEDASDDSEAEGDFKSEYNDINASDDAESPSKKTKTGGQGKVKVEVDDVEEDGQFHDSGFETGFGGDGTGEMEEGMFA
ncbi:hypothetical protein OEA41_009388 [Lepraria neglecta]|uniref:Uncharacterized protein n=1 Tax=Lepraria neglecta TaxID=209136 RepID=A0AAD9Z5S2_9LECA|nr:hypothetical protein OEA41_009388 [Lepraria neglecta]